MIRMRRNAEHDANYSLNNSFTKEGDIMLLKSVERFEYTPDTLYLIAPKGHPLECLNASGVPANINTFDYIGVQQ